MILYLFVVFYFLVNLDVILVLYSAADAKTAVHEDTDEFVLISATMFVMMPACRRGSMAPAASRSVLWAWAWAWAFRRREDLSVG